MAAKRGRQTNARKAAKTRSAAKNRARQATRKTTARARQATRKTTVRKQNSVLRGGTRRTTMPGATRSIESLFTRAGRNRPSGAGGRKMPSPGITRLPRY